MNRRTVDMAAGAALTLVIVLALTGLAVSGIRQLTLEGAFTPSPASPGHTLQLAANLLGTFLLLAALATFIFGVSLKVLICSKLVESGEQMQRKAARLLAQSLMIALIALAILAVLPVLATTPTPALPSRRPIP